MCRKNREKSESAIYHVMSRSCSEFNLFRDDSDRERYLRTIKKYKDIFLFKIYSYCIMSTHVHLMLDCCGADISKIMHGINQSYSQYYNKKYQRRGHVFQDRFKSIIIHDDKYSLVLSAYIHRNPKNIENFKDCIQKYSYSSLGIYLGIREDVYSLVDKGYILNMFPSSSVCDSEKQYLNFVNYQYHDDDNLNGEFEKDKGEYRSERNIIIRNYSPEEIVSRVMRIVGMNKDIIFCKYNHHASVVRGVCIAVMRSFCNFTYKEICSIFGNLTLSSVSRLSTIGFETIYSDKKYKNLFSLIAVS